MRDLAAFVLVLALAACSAAPPPSCGAPGLVRACACVGGAQGAQECGPGGAWSVCMCPDGGAMEAGVDAGRDAAQDVGRDTIPTPVDVDPGCDGGAPSRCGAACVDRDHDQENCGTCGRVCAGTLSECVFGICQIPLDPDAGRCGRLTECAVPGGAFGCFNLSTSSGMIPARHCGACDRACPSSAPACVDGRCTEARDGG